MGGGGGGGIPAMVEVLYQRKQVKNEVLVKKRKIVMLFRPAITTKIL
jgi:hypothetical protein